jgi:hypothetical protein
MKSTLHLVLVLSAVGFVALPVRADVIPPEVDACRNKAVGAACSTSGLTGSCQNQTCHRLDYSSWDRDASASPPSMAYACVECTTATDTNTSTSTGTNTATNNDGGDSPTKDSGSCSIGTPSAAKRVAPWLLAAAFSSLFLIGRKRRR